MTTVTESNSIRFAGLLFGPHVYLSGTLLFVAGLAIVRAHDVWSDSWQVLITLVGWFAMAVGMNALALYCSLGAVLTVGSILSFKAYAAGRR